MKPYRTENKKIKLNGKMLEVKINIFCEPSGLALEDIIGDAENQKELEYKIERGLLDICDLAVEVSALGIEGFDSLSGCYITSPEDVDMYLKDHAMVKQALESFKKCLEHTFKSIEPYVKAA